MSEFHLPYQFILATGKINTEAGKKSTATIDFQQIQDGVGDHTNARHDLWFKNKLHGRITCRLHLETPLVVGAEHVPIGKRLSHDKDDKRQQKIEPYRFNGQCAIPANSLRGMVASIAETISQSSLRVLENKPLNVTYGYHGKDGHTAGNTYDLFPPNILPMSEQRRNNSTQNSNNKHPLLTPAEILFGVVEDNKDSENLAITLKSRLKFYDALPKESEDHITLEEECTLRILDSPKPPAPAMYFYHTQDPTQYISKKEFEVANKNYKPRGRKVYLHHQQIDINEQKWITTDDTKSANQKMKCTPIKAKQNFYFHVGFENLSSAELKLLKTSLFPAPEFRHRLGLGKSLGLGSINVTEVATEFYKPIERYSISSLEYETNNINCDVNYDDTDTSLIDSETLSALITIGKRAENGEINLKKNVPVRYPFMPDSDEEENLYKWYQSNEKLGPRGKGQVLGIIKANQTLPTLFTPPQNAPRQFYAKYNTSLNSNEPQRGTAKNNLPNFGKETHEEVNFIHTKGETISDENQWIRDHIIISPKAIFENLSTTDINKRLTSPDLARKWKDLSEKEPKDVEFKEKVKQLILDSVKERKIEGYWNSSGPSRAKKIYDNWAFTQ